MKKSEEDVLDFNALTKMDEQFVLEFYTPTKDSAALKIIAHRELDPDSMAHINPYAKEFKENIATYEISFPTYLTFSVINDMVGMAFCSEDDEYEGDSFRIYSKSLYYELINREIDFKEHFNGGMVHYGFMDIWQQIDILSISPPLVKEISADKGISLE